VPVIPAANADCALTCVIFPTINAAFTILIANAILIIREFLTAYLIKIHLLTLSMHRDVFLFNA
jgi:hypothetical protein